jgi:GTP-binding protein Era
VLSANSPGAKKQFLDMLLPRIPEGPRYYPDDELLTDENLRYFASELIRKQIINLTTDEVPHAACVEILDYKESEQLHDISALIHVETEGQKAIIIGKGGTVIAKIRKHAQTHLKRLTGVRARIQCRVKVTERWRDNESFLMRVGLVERE